MSKKKSNKNILQKQQSPEGRANQNSTKAKDGKTFTYDNWKKEVKKIITSNNPHKTTQVKATSQT